MYTKLADSTGCSRCLAIDVQHLCCATGQNLVGSGIFSQQGKVKGGIYGINSREIDQTAPATHQVLQNTSPYSAPRQFQQQADFIIYYLHPKQRKAQISLLFNNNINLFSTASNVWNKYTIAKYQPQRLTQLSPPESRLWHQEIQDSRVQNVRKWPLQTKEFRSWCAGNKGDAVLFCYGDQAGQDLY